MNRKIIFLGITLILLAVGIRAAQFTGDFSLETECTTPARTVYTLTNNTSIEQTYTISAIGENADWIILNGKKIASQPLQIPLQAGQSEGLVAFVSPTECYVPPGRYTITIRIKNGGTQDEEIEVIVLVSTN